MASFLQNLLTVLFGFFKSFISLFSADILFLLNWIGGTISAFFYEWGSSFARYGPFIPTIFVAVIGVTIAGVYASFVLFRGADDLVGGGS